MPTRTDVPESETPGTRVYLIRRALGPNVRQELPLRAFADLVNAKVQELGAALGVTLTFDASTIAKIERGVRRLAIEEVPLFAALDPEQRGRSWLAWGDAPPPAPARRPSPIDGLPADDGHLVDVTPSHQKKGRRRKS